MPAPFVELLKEGTPWYIIVIVAVSGLLIWAIRRTVEQKIETERLRLKAELDEQKAVQEQRLIELKNDGAVMQQLIEIIAANTKNIGELAAQTQKTLDVLASMRSQADDTRSVTVKTLSAVDAMHIQILRAINAMGENNDAALLQITNELRTIQQLLDRRFAQIKKTTDEIAKPAEIIPDVK